MDASPKKPSRWERLTPVERTVAQLLADGLSNKEIGERMFISPRTVQWHLRNIYTKIGVSTRSQLISRFHKDSP